MSGAVVEAAPVPGAPLEPGSSGAVAGTGSWIPTWGLISTKLMELRRRRGLMVAVVLLVLGIPVLIMGIRLLFHAFDPKSYGPAGSPSMFEVLCSLIASFGFIMAAAVGTTAGTTDLTEGVFRQLVVTGRSRLALYLSRIPAGLAILLPLVAVTFGLVCLVTSYAGTAQPTTVNVNGSNIPAGLSEPQLEHWLLGHVQEVFPPGTNLVTPGGKVVSIGPSPKPADVTRIRAEIRKNIGSFYSQYQLAEISSFNPAINEMVKIGLWLELYIGIGFVVGLGLGSLMGQRTVSTILMIALEILITPILAAHQIPYFINGQRLIVGIAMDQLRPIGLASAGNGPNGPHGALFGGRGALGYPPMPEWAMIAVIVGWIVGWTVIGAWRMMTRDA